MDERRFDLLAKALTEASSRRDALKVTAVGVAAGIFGITLAEDEAEAKKNKKKKKKLCECPDNNENNCVTKKVKKKKAQQIKDKYPNSYNGACEDDGLDNNTECNTNRPGECRSTICCYDVTSSSGGICATDGGTCCNRPNLGGYCPVNAPFCCGLAACCADTKRCCSGALNPTGTCCPEGRRCDPESGFCILESAAVSRDAEVVDPTVARIRAGNAD